MTAALTRRLAVLEHIAQPGGVPRLCDLSGDELHAEICNELAKMLSAGMADVTPPARVSELLERLRGHSATAADIALFVDPDSLQTGRFPDIGETIARCIASAEGA